MLRWDFSVDVAGDAEAITKRLHGGIDTSILDFASQFLDKMLKQYTAKLLRTLDPADLQPALKTLLDGMGRWTTRSTRAT